ncbi:FAD/NAD(P)-binding domain-containing protein [Glonium stellatum]|uniref:FAD/NAD(P)-binding domain-containing protein n=1 Tax=Glonium stellatum TaxID=574774 RepID=A0A8E2F6I7_9PEZI|nr:FAD/NAD(P)-binding domain-containing protein [Glonium stellatum]
MPQETILILGASFAGLGAAHYTLKHILPSLPQSPTTYSVTLVNPSPDFYWRIAGPRATISSTLLPRSKYLHAIAPHFSAYPSDRFTFLQGTATGLDAAGRTATITLPDGATTAVPYAALVIATGTRTPAPQFSLQSASSSDLVGALEAFAAALPAAQTVVTAGEVGEALNGAPGFFGARPARVRARVTLVSAEQKLLPVLRPAIAATAEKYLARVGVEVVYGVRVTEAREREGGGREVVLADGRVLEADLYVDATGVRPNAGWLPRELVDERGYVVCDKKTLRVDGAGPRVYVLGDVGSYTRGGAMDIDDALPVVMSNLKKDLLGADGPDRTYTPNLSEQQIVPVGRGKGVGAFAGWRVPSWFVWMIKGRDYLCSMAPDVVSGKKWAKENKWKGVQEKAGLQGGK